MTTSFHGSLPNFLCASAMPRTVPGTPGARYPAAVSDSIDVAVRAEIHRRRGFARRRLAVVERGGGARSGVRTIMKPPPPMLPAVGYVTAIANAVATAASTALPPMVRISAPMSDASPVAETTTPVRELTPKSEESGLVWVCAAGPDPLERHEQQGEQGDAGQTHDGDPHWRQA